MPTNQPHAQYDTTLKDLFDQPPQYLLQWLVGQQAIALLPVEFATTQKRLPDLAFLLEDEAILHLELQAKPEGMEWRMLTYYGLFRLRYPQHRLIQKVLYIGPEEWTPNSAIREENLHFHYEVVDIREIDCRILMASPALNENLLAILCRMENEQETIQEILRRIAELPPKARNDALTKLLILAKLRKLEPKVKEETEEMAITFNIMENEVLGPMFLKAQQESKQEGRQEGLKEGLKEGEAAMLLRLMRRRFGQVPDWVVDKITTASTELLESWGERILDAGSIEEVLTH